MIDAAAISGAYAGLKAAKDLLKGAFDAKVDAEVKTKVYEAMERLGDSLDTLYAMRGDMFDLQTEIQKLKRELADAQAWDAKAATYSLASSPGGAIAYKFNGEPAHWACTNCFAKREVQPLQTNRTMSGKYRCVSCTAEFPIELQRQPAQAMAQTRTPWSG
jgi:hypothetical protein